MPLVFIIYPACVAEGMCMKDPDRGNPWQVTRVKNEIHITVNHSSCRLS
jgi:hypothetical protein